MALRRINPRGRTRIDASVTQGKTTQDDAFLPTTINTFLVPAHSGVSYDGEHRNSSARLVVTSRPFRPSGGRLAARLRLDNRSPELTFADYVQTDFQFPLCGNVNVCDTNGDGLPNDRTARRSLPYGYSRRSVGALAGWSPVHWFRGALSFERERFEREFSAVTKSDEDILKLTLDFDISTWLTARTTLRQQERRADHYDALYFEESFPSGEPAEADFNEGAALLLTDRDRDAYAHAGRHGHGAPRSMPRRCTRTTLHRPQHRPGHRGVLHLTEDRNLTASPDLRHPPTGRTEDRSTSYSLGAPLPRSGSASTPTTPGTPGSTAWRRATAHRRRGSAPTTRSTTGGATWTTATTPPPSAWT